MKIASNLKVKIQHSTAVKSRAPRIKHKYESNLSIARMRESGHALCAFQTIFQALKCPITRDLIRDHSYRRVQLFYSTAVVYHNEKCRLGIDTTISQVGRSTCSRCNAAHHALGPRWWDDSNIVMYKSYVNNPQDQLLRKKLKALGMNLKQIPVNASKRKVKSFFEDFKRNHTDRLIKKESFLQYALDSTIEVREEVNRYECVFENHMRKPLIGLMQSVSYGELEPYEATELFVSKIHEFFDKSAKSIKKTIKFLNQLGAPRLSAKHRDDLRRRIRAQKYIRRVLKKQDPVSVLKADLEIIKQQRSGTVVPPREYLELGQTPIQQKLQLFRG